MEKEKLFCIQTLDDLPYSSVTFLLLLFKGLLGVCPKEERHLVVPADLAYGERGAGEVIPPNATLLFDIVVMDVEKVQKFVKIQQDISQNSHEISSTLLLLAKKQMAAKFCSESIRCQEHPFMSLAWQHGILTFCLVNQRPVDQ